MGRLTTEAAPAPDLDRLALLVVEWDGKTYVMHSYFSVLVGPYDPERRLFGCRGEIPSEGLPAITDIPVISFAVCPIVRNIPLENHIVHVEGVSTSIWWMKPCNRGIGKAEGRNY